MSDAGPAARSAATSNKMVPKDADIAVHFDKDLSVDAFIEVVTFIIVWRVRCARWIELWKNLIGKQYKAKFHWDAGQANDEQIKGLCTMGEEAKKNDEEQIGVYHQLMEQDRYEDAMLMTQNLLKSEAERNMLKEQILSLAKSSKSHFRQAKSNRSDFHKIVSKICPFLSSTHDIMERELAKPRRWKQTIQEQWKPSSLAGYLDEYHDWRNLMTPSSELDSQILAHDVMIDHLNAGFSNQDILRAFMMAYPDSISKEQFTALENGGARKPEHIPSKQFMYQTNMLTYLLPTVDDEFMQRRCEFVNGLLAIYPDAATNIFALIKSELSLEAPKVTTNPFADKIETQVMSRNKEPAPFTHALAKTSEFRYLYFFGTHEEVNSKLQTPSICDTLFQYDLSNLVELSQANFKEDFNAKMEAQLGRRGTPINGDYTIGFTTKRKTKLSAQEIKSIKKVYEKAHQSSSY